MTVKRYIYFITIILLGSSFAHGKKSFVIVTDTTASMTDEITIMKNNIDSVVMPLKFSAGFENFILVPFTDPDVGIPKISSSPEGLVNFLNDIEVQGGYDCLENSLAGVEKALEISRDNSVIFLFTDAPAKDVNKLPFVQTMCRQRLTQVVTFLSGECPGVAANNMNVYKEIAKTCSGTVFHIDIHSLPQVFKYMKEIVNVEWTDIHTHEEFMGTKQFNFNVDKYTKDVIVAVAGDYPEIQITNAGGKNPILKRIMDSKHALVIRLVEPEIGEYVAEVCSRGLSLTTFYKWKALRFLYGFSTKKPRNLQETSLTPIPDATSYLIIEQLDTDIELMLLELQIDNIKKTLQLEILNEAERLYMVQAFFESEKPFRISIHGREPHTYEVIKGTTKVIVPQTKITPHLTGATVETIKLKSTVVEFMSNVTLFCKVTGDPKPDIWLEDDNGNKIDSEDALFEWPSTYISLATIDNATTNSTIYCKGKNSEGESSLSAELYIHREFTFEMLQSPADITLEYGSEGKLYCEAKAYPEATIKWYHNDSLIENSENVEIVPEDNMLLIKQMNLENSGEYKCEATNDVESRMSPAAVVDISGLEAPSIEITEAEFILKPGDSMEVDCDVKGSPKPEVTWKKLVDDEFVDVTGNSYVEDNVLKISSAMVNHRGVYKCEASNVLGVDAKEVTVKVQYIPNIKDVDKIKMVKIGESVQLECDVDAEPKAEVHWDMYQGDVIIAFDERHYTDEQYTHRFIAQPNDSGVYHCIAENEMGTAERKVTINILETPYLEPLKFKTITVRTGASISIPCNVLVGRPVPSTRWEFISPKSGITVIASGITTLLDLHLRNISKANEGVYQCVAENEDSLDSIKFNLIVQQ